MWIFGGIDRYTKECFALRVNSRNAPTLCGLIEEFVLPGIRLFTDGWKSYEGLKNEGFLHEVELMRRFKSITSILITTTRSIAIDLLGMAART